MYIAKSKSTQVVTRMQCYGECELFFFLLIRGSQPLKENCINTPPKR